jgi:ElaB/YqjD/DUF883 family membrane-anchored ribosome-binding protein
MPDAQPQDPTITSGAAGATGSANTAENRTFAEGVDLSGETPAELLMDDVQPATGANTAAQPGSNGKASFSDTAGAGVQPLKAAASQLASSVRDVLSGKAGSARTMAKDTYDQLRDRTAVSRTKADTFVREKPYTAVGAAVVVGMLLSSLMRRR